MPKPPKSFLQQCADWVGGFIIVGSCIGAVILWGLFEGLSWLWHHI